MVEHMFDQTMCRGIGLLTATGDDVCLDGVVADADRDAVLARLQAENAALRAETEALRADAARARDLETVVAWFRGGLEDDDAREAMTRSLCRQYLSRDEGGTPESSEASESAGSVVPSLLTVASVLAAEQMPSALSVQELAAAAVACRAVVTLGELTQARLTRELAWRYQWREGQGLDAGTGPGLDLDGRVPEWLRDVEDKAVAVAVAEVAALARMSPAVLRARVELVDRYRNEHPALFHAVVEGRVSTGRARVIAREVERLPGLRERWWVTDRILPGATRGRTTLLTTDPAGPNHEFLPRRAWTRHATSACPRDERCRRQAEAIRSLSSSAPSRRRHRPEGDVPWSEESS